MDCSTEIVNDGSDRQCQSQQRMPPGKQKQGRCAAQAAIASEPLENVCDSCLRKRPYGRVNVFRARRNDGKKERTA
jgi:hypothetical protein